MLSTSAGVNKRMNNPPMHPDDSNLSDSPESEFGEVQSGKHLIAPGGKVCPKLVRQAARLHGIAIPESPYDSILVEHDPDRDSLGENGQDDGALTVRFKLARDLQKRLDKYLQDRIPFMSRTQLQLLIKEGGVTVNDKSAKASTKLRKHDVVGVIVPPPPSDEIPEDNIPLEILFEDDNLIVLNKQADIVVHPSRSHKTGTIINGLAYHFQHRSSGALSEVGKDKARPGVVHRLDRFTTGALICAKTNFAHWKIGRQFEERTTDKRYLAIVAGRMEPVMDTIHLPIGKHPLIRELQAVRHDEGGKPSTTIYRVREQFERFALVELELKTGRTHQIRVHLAHLGWPIVGDDLYDGPLLNQGDVIDGADPDEPLMHRQCLHAWSIGFDHPVSGERMHLTAPLPEDFHHLLKVLRSHRRIHRPITPSGATIDLDAVLPDE